MTEREIFETFMSWIGMSVDHKQREDGFTYVIYHQNERGKDCFETLGYDEFYSGAVFNDKGEIKMAYLDSHVAYSSDNSKIIWDKIQKIKSVNKL